MATLIDNIPLDETNIEFNNAAEFIRHTDKLVYLTGKAGTGKTTFLKYIKSVTNKNTVILAPTGVAAINAGGQTINSFFQIPFGPFIPDDSRLRTIATGTDNRETIYTTFKYREDKREIIKNLELLIIDEISMVRADTLDVIDRVLKVFRKKPYLPFGGVQVILIGDTFQLPPIVENEQWSILSQFYKTPFFFSSKIIEQTPPLYIELKKIYRQNEQEFIDLLNRIRVSQVNATDYNILNAKYNPTFSGNGSDYIILATHNKFVNETNLTKLNQLTTGLFTYEATVTGTFPDKEKPTDHYLRLKVGAQVMFIKNDIGTYKRYYNGKIGKIKELGSTSITVIFDDESVVEVERTVWNNIRYSYNKEQKKIVEETVGTFEQFPIRLAWAITVHKSQGLTFEKVIADLGNAFAPGQVYVALSRCTSSNGLILKTPLNSNAIKTDPRVIEFAQNETPGTLITEQLNTGKADFYYKKVREDIKSLNFVEAYDNFVKAIKFRNDIETDLFKKYFVSTATRLSSFKKKHTDILNKFETVVKENKVLQISISELEIEKQSQQTKINDQNKAVKLLLDKTNDFQSDKIELQAKINEQENKISELINETKVLQKQREKLKSDISTLMIEKANSENVIQQYQKTVQENNSTISKLEIVLRDYEREIERLRNLKWYQKLFGQK